MRMRQNTASESAELHPHTPTPLVTPEQSSSIKWNYELIRTNVTTIIHTTQKHDLLQIKRYCEIASWNIPRRDDRKCQ